MMLCMRDKCLIHDIQPDIKCLQDKTYIEFVKFSVKENGFVKILTPKFLLTR